MNDRELLKRAAHAAGIKIVFDPSEQARNVTGAHPSMNLFSAPVWNPLTDDGDALRLAVKLGMFLQTEALGGFLERGVEAYCTKGLTEGQAWISEEEGITDPYAATRRAIVRTAAAMAD